MKRALVALLGLFVALAPISPTLATGHPTGDDQGPAGGDGASSTFEGEHLRFEIDRELPGLHNLTVVETGALVFDSIALPGSPTGASESDDRVRLRTDVARLDAQDDEDLPVYLDSDEGHRIELTLAPDVQVTEQAADDGVRYQLTPPEGPELALSADDGALDGDTISVEGQALFRAAQAANGSGDADPPEDDGDAGNESQARENESDRAPDRSDRSDTSVRERRVATDGNYTVGAVQFHLENDTITDLTFRNQTLFASLRIPDLRPAEVRHHGSHLELRGEDARFRVSGQDGMLVRAETEMRITAEIAEGVDARLEDDHAFLQTDRTSAVVQGDELRLSDGRLSADGELRIAVRSQVHAQGPVWMQDEAGRTPTQLPFTFEGRFVEFDLDATSLSNLTVHGTPLGEVSFDPVEPDQLRRAGSQLGVEGDGFELHAIDAPATQIRIEADGLSADVPNRTSLPSGAEILVHQEDDELVIRVTKPDGVLSNRTAFEHRPSEAPVERTEGPEPGLRAKTRGGELGVRSSDPGTVAASFSGRQNGTTGNVSMELGLTRAMLIEDTNGNGRLDVGEPAVAERALTNGTTEVQGDELISRFQLWSGNLSVVVEPGDETAKVTYEVHNLSAPPGTLFVLETRVQAPPGANLTPTDDGVKVQNGSMEARYSAAGPVTVDGGEAWADRSIFVDSNDTVRVMLAYPAGDDIVHDPTLAIQSVPGTQAIDRLTASPWAVVFGALAATMLVGVTVWQRRRGPRV